MLRRRFLAAAAQAAGGLGGVLAAGTAPAFLRHRSPNEVIRVAVVGCGGRGMCHLKTLGYLAASDPRNKGRSDVPFPLLDGVECVAVCDAYTDNLGWGAKAVRNGGGRPAAYADYRELLEKEQIDTVVVATPDHLHVPMTLDAMDAGCDVYLEKCMSNSLDGANALGETMKRTGRILQVGHQGRQDKINRMAGSIIRREDLGKVTLIQSFLSRGGESSAWIKRFSHDGGPPRERVSWDLFRGPAPDRPYDARRFFEWRRYWDYSTGIAGDLMSHDLDTIHQAMGLGVPHSAMASGGVYYWKDGRETPDTFSVVLEYPDHDLSVTYSCNLHNSYNKRATVFLGSDATMELNWEINAYPDRGSVRYAEQLASGEFKPNRPFIRVRKKSGDLVAMGGPSTLWLENQGLMFTERDGEICDTTRLHHEDFFQAVRDRSEPDASFQSCYGPTVATHLATEAYKQGRRMVWDPEKRRAV